MHFREWKVMHLIKISLRVHLTKLRVGLDNGLAPDRRQAIIWTNADPIHWRIYAALGGDKLSHWSIWLRLQTDNIISVQSHWHSPLIHSLFPWNNLSMSTLISETSINNIQQQCSWASFGNECCLCVIKTALMVCVLASRQWWDLNNT